MDAEVVIVGYGPVGQLAANLLGAAGVSTLVLERAAALHPLPRAAAIDDDALRILQAVGLDREARAAMLANVPIAFTTRRGREVRLVDPVDTANAHPYVALLHQPALERVLDTAARARPGVEVRFGAEVASLVQGRDAVVLELTDGTVVRAAYVIACDGAASPLREQLGIGFDGSTSAEPWLVVDLLLDAPRARPPIMRFLGDTARPKVSVPMGERRHRWELMALPGEDLRALAAPARVRELLAPHVDLDRVEVERAAVYSFHARIATRWRAGRVLLAGDAAHVMPPFAGQGMCAGLRDVHNLAWKLTAVLREGVDPALLDTYEPERRPHVTATLRLAVVMGAVLQTRRPRLATARDLVLRVLSAAPVLGPRARAGGPRPSPRYRHGALGPGGGRPFGQPMIDGVRLDDRLGAGWALLGADGDPHAALGPAARAAFAGVGGLAVDRALLGGAALLVLRPDRFVFACDAADGAAAAAAYARVMRPA